MESITINIVNSEFNERILSIVLGSKEILSIIPASSTILVPIL